MTATTAGAVVVTNAGNHLAQVTPAPIDLPVVGVVDDFYEAREGMKVTFVDTLSVAEYFELARYGQIELFEGGRPRQFTEMFPPSVAGYTAHLEALDRRRVILDDDDNSQNVSLLDANGFQFVYPPVANGGFSVGTQGVDYFRGGDLVNGLTGVLDWSFAGATGHRRLADPADGGEPGRLHGRQPAAGDAARGRRRHPRRRHEPAQLLHHHRHHRQHQQRPLRTERNARLPRRRQRRRAQPPARARLDRDLRPRRRRLRFRRAREHDNASAAITDLLGAVNTRCGGAQPYAFVNTGGTLGTDAIRVAADLSHRRAGAGRRRRSPTSMRSTTGRRPRRRSMSSMPRIRLSASASR